ncbi:hypothetical protein [Kitasatospora sp. SUK 42]|uniref:hypothetical protein n=1 Tax=Kitasatospora sp. SUK 42 TaxID=1588882 RepID=UPI0018CADB93|nr:hypothetical protein [Kitasatospora sp. SUK 42]MBV2152871.1 hypothetical protein [Kitasatospora sp. SUK 42]
MRTSVITRFAKNDRPLSGRRRLAALAATTLLVGGVQFLATDTAWACAGPYPVTAPTSAPTAPAVTHDGELQAGFHQTRDGQTLTAGGPKVEVGVGIANFTGAPYENVAAAISLFNPVPGAGLRPQDFTVEVASGGTWKPVSLEHGCDPSLHTTATPATVIKHLENGRAEHRLFRIGLSSKAPKELKSITVSVLGQAPHSKAVGSDSYLTFPVAHPAAPAPKPTATAKPTTPAKAKPAAPAADQAPAQADTTPTAVPSATPSAAPATTAPAGTPELAHTGASTTNTFLALTSAVLLALGAGVLTAVRRLRTRR